MSSPQLTGDGRNPQRTWKECGTILARRKWVIVHCLWVTVFIVTAGSFVLPPKYEAQGKLLLHRGRRDIVVTPASTNEFAQPQSLSDEDLNSEVEVLTSRPLREEVVRRLRLWEEEAGLGRRVMRRVRETLVQLQLLEPLTDEQRAILSFERRLDVSVVRKSNIILVVYPDSRPDRAAAVVNTLFEIYLDRHQKFRQVPGNRDFFAGQAEALRRSLDRSENALKKFETRESLGALSKQKDAIVTKLVDFEANLKTTQADVAETVKKIDSLRAQLRSEPERLKTPNRSFQSVAAEEMERKLVALEAERNRLVQSYRPDSRRLVDLDEEIRLNRERLERALLEAGPLDRTEVNPVYQNLQKDLLAAETALATLRTREAKLTASVGNYRRTLEDLNAKGYVQNAMQRLIKADEDAYLLYLKKLEEARIEDAMTERRMLSVSIAEPAAPPLKPKFPNKPLNILLAMILGTLGGIGVTLVQDLVSRSVWSERDLEEGVGVPVLGVLPETPSLQSVLLKNNGVER